MEASAKMMNLRVSSKKVRLVVDQIRGMKVEPALSVLEYSRKRVARALRDTLKSAIANAENNFNMNVDTLVVSKAFVDEGPVTKRFRPRARGRASRILKRSSHVTFVVRAGE